jgi:citrate lyase subunit beta / citryl-CoA lyase
MNDDPGRWLQRSSMYVVAHNERHVQKAYESEVDAVILELEDAVAPSMKVAAREAAVEILSSPPPKPTYVRVNPFGTGLTLADIEAVAGLPIDAIRIAKTESREDAYTVGRLLDELDSEASVQVLLESAKGVEAIEGIVRAHPRVVGVGIGEQDLRADLGAAEDGLLYARSRAIFAARAAGLAPPWQSVWIDLKDQEGLRETTVAGKQLGFFGRSAIHPSQVGIINEVFTPTDEELARARELTEALDDAKDAGSAGLQLPDGTFIDNAVVLGAQRTLAFGRRAAASGTEA